MIKCSIVTLYKGIVSQLFRKRRAFESFLAFKQPVKLSPKGYVSTSTIPFSWCGQYIKTAPIKEGSPEFPVGRYFILHIYIRKEKKRLALFTMPLWWEWKTILKNLDFIQNTPKNNTKHLDLPSMKTFFTKMVFCKNSPFSKSAKRHLQFDFLNLNWS